MDFSIKGIKTGPRRSLPRNSIRSDSLETSAAVFVFESPAHRITTANLLPPDPCDIRRAPEAGTLNPEGGQFAPGGAFFAKMAFFAVGRTQSGECRGGPAEAGPAQPGRSEDSEDRADSERIPAPGFLGGSAPPQSELFSTKAFLCFRRWCFRRCGPTHNT